MTTLALSVDHEELAGSPEEVWTDQRFDATRRLKCDWDDRLLLARQLLGGYDPQMGVIWPAPYPAFPQARAVHVDIQPFGTPTPLDGDNRRARYPHALLAVRYTTERDESDTPTTLVTETLEPTTEAVTLDPHRFAWEQPRAHGGVPLHPDEAPHRLHRGLDYVYTIHAIAALNHAVLQLVGKVNQAPIVSQTLGLVFPERTLLYNPPTLQRRISPAGAEAWRVTYRFSYRPETWNAAYRAQTAQHEPIFGVEGDTPVALYEQGDFTLLLSGLSDDP